MEKSGFQLGAFSVRARLGVGGMGEVWLATRGEQRFVLKTLLPHLADDPRMLEMFIKEARVASRVSGPNVVRMFEHGEHRGQHFLVLEYVEGVSLDRLLARVSPLPPLLSAYIAWQACEGLSAIHEQTGMAVVHRDISPGNLLVSTAGVVKVADFGIAKTYTTDPGSSTTVGTTKGKIAYMSPEQAKGMPVDARTDVFALGVVMYQMLHGELPYAPTKNDYEMLAQVVYGRRRPLAEVAPQTPAALAAIVEKALALELTARWQTARAMRDALEAFVAGGGGSDAATLARELGAQVRACVQASPAARPTRPTAEIQPISDSMLVDDEPGDTVSDRPAPKPVAGVGLDEEPPGPTLLSPRSAGRSTFDEVPPDDALLHPTPKSAPTFDAAEPTATSAEAPYLPDELPQKHTEPDRRLPRGWVPVAIGAATLAVIIVVGVALAARERATPVATAPIAAAEPVLPPAPPPEVPAPAEPEPAMEVAPAAAVAVVPEAAPPPEAPSPSAAAKPAPAAARMKVTVETSPACDVYLGKRKLGRSPVDVAVGAEPLALRLVSEADGINLDYALVAKRGEPTRRVEVPRAKLDLRISPWAEVTLDGRALGVSPLPPTMLYAGRHGLDLVNGELKVRRHVDFELAPGETRTIREKLE